MEIHQQQQDELELCKAELKSVSTLHDNVQRT